jgi:hypothetical protein
MMRYGIDAKLFEWSDEIVADRPRRFPNPSARAGNTTLT